MKVMLIGLALMASGPMLWKLNFWLMALTGDPFAPFHPVFMALAVLSFVLVPIGLLVAGTGFLLIVNHHPFSRGDR